MDSGIAYLVIRKVLANGGYTQAMAANPDAVLQEEGMKDLHAIEELKQILSVIVSAKMKDSKEIANLQEWLSQQRETTGKTADTFKKGLQNTIEQIESGFCSTATMYKP